MCGKARVLEPIAHELEDFLHPRLDDGDELRLRQMRRTLAVLARLNHRDCLGFIGNRHEAAAIKRLQPFGIGERDPEAARDIHRDVMAADGERVDMGQMAAGKDAHGRCPRAHVDQGGAEFGFIVGQGRKTRRVRRGDHRVDRQMAAFDREHQVACGSGVAA